LNGKGYYINIYVEKQSERSKTVFNSSIEVENELM